jgi:hypothetical protein
MPMIKRFYLLAIIVMFSSFTYGQRWKLTRYEAMVGIGTANCFGDIGGAATQKNWFGLKDAASWNTVRSTRPSFYLGARYKIRQDMAFKFNIIYGYMRGDDKGSLNSDRGLDGKGYSYRTHTIETSLQYEYSFIQDDRRKYSFALFNRRGMINNYSKINIYGFGGIGSIVYFPKFTGQPYPNFDYTTGYGHVALTFPLGIGLKYIYNNKYAFGLELGGRYTTTDYLEGLHTKVSDFNDIYYFGVINFVYRLKTTRKGLPIIFGRWQ